MTTSTGMSFQYLLFFLVVTFLPFGLARNGSSSSPLSFSILLPILSRPNMSLLKLNTTLKCHFVLQSLRLVLSDYLRRTGSFFPPLNASESCWQSYQSLFPDFDIRSSCGFQAAWISQGCMNLTTKAFYLRDSSISNVSDCTAYPLIYAAAVANYFGPTDEATASCLFSINLSDNSNGEENIGFRGRKGGIGLGILRAVLNRVQLVKVLVKFTFDEIKEATRNFSINNIIGRGGYGNVYKGYLCDGSEVALKRFKNCSAAGDSNFKHEVEVIGGVRHVNLVALRGYCAAVTPLEGHQRIIVCDLMKNGSLYDHLFGPTKVRLSWPIRQRIALGIARGLAYLHYGAQPTIIHRDINASNILLDDMFEAKVADFGLAKFTPEGMTHLSTRVAGTTGYVAPEYALYGQLTDRSDVYSFGVVLLELLSGKKALTMNDENQPSVVADWARSLVKNEKALDVIEDGMPELGPPEVLEKYVFIAVLCSHPEFQCRPSMDQVVNMLETDVSVPSIPERSIPLVAHVDEIER
ncbi:hypothetical protein V6N11_012195 [Hibiscus sabdariffa]|uniref:Protein kinase domain-containing protein n=1 Tax=Hibiscus sabdariffa TaxID=183260 RepID=A0ABR2QAC5_9ROSI